MIRRIFTAIFLAMTIGCLSGCLAAIHQSGKDLNVHGKQTRQEVEAVLGKSSYVVSFSPAIRADQIGALQYWLKPGDAEDYPSLIPDPSQRVSFKAYYLYHGAQKNHDETGEVTGMEIGIALSSLGLSEIILLPDALEHRRLKNQDVHLFIVFYNEAGDVIARRYSYLGRSLTSEGACRLLAEYIAEEQVGQGLP